MRIVAHERFLPGLSEEELRGELEGLVRAARDLGVRPIEVDIERESGRAVGIFLAPDEGSVVEAHRAAGVGCEGVLPVEPWWADLLLPPRT